MLKKFIYGLVTVLFLASCASAGKASSDDAIDLDVAIRRSAEDIMKKVPSNTIIAFFNISESDYSVLTEYVIEEISVILVDRAKLTVVDRNNMDVIDAEHEFQMSGRVSDDDIISIAKKYGAATVASCSVTGQFNLRRLRVRALDVETGKVQSLTSYSVKNLSDYAIPQSTTSRASNVPSQVGVSPGNNTAQQPSATPPTPIAYEIGTDDDTVSVTNRTLRNDSVDFFLLTPGVSGWIVMETTGNVDTYMEFYDAENNMLAEDDDSGSFYNARIRYNVQAGRRYSVKVQGYDSGNYGFRAYRERVYKIGDRGPAGGIVFYDKVTFSDGWRYLEAAPADTEISDARWGTFRYDVSGTEVDLGSGKSNTYTINYYLSFLNESGRAAQLCTQLNSGGYDDWFLPSLEELNWMYLNLHSKGFGGFRNDRYWSSSQVNSNYAWYRHFGDRGRASHDKDKDGDGWVFRYNIRVRAIRSF